MSYEIVRSISINKDNEVWCTSACSNIIPKTFEKWEILSLSKIAKESGRDECHKEILYLYWSGEFQKTNNDYDKSVQYFRIINDKFYNWDNVGRNKEYSEEYIKNMLLDNYKKYKKRNRNSMFVIQHKITEAYIIRKHWYSMDLNKAKTFNNLSDTLIFINTMYNSELTYVKISQGE